MRVDAPLDTRYRDLLESAPDSIVIADPSGHIVFANAHAETLFGYGRSDLQGMPVETLLPPRFRAAHLAHRAGYFEQPRARAMGAGLELYGLRHDGTEFPVEISLSPLQIGGVALVMSAIRDITERKAFERELQVKNLQLEDASRAKDRFLARMSHEFRTPLNAIIGFTGTLLMRLPGPLTADQEKQLRTVQSSARHLLSLINDLLDLAKVQAGKIELVRESVDCRDVVEEVVATLRPEAERKGLAFTMSLPGTLRPLETDRRAVSQIVINLVQNAIKFTARGGVHVSVTEGSGAGAPALAIRVEDTGPGIRPQDQDKVFEAFSRVDGLERRALEGTGLGLHLSRHLAGLLGARITFESEFGHGSAFSLEWTEAAAWPRES